MIEAEALAQHAADLRRKALLARVVAEQALGFGQQLDDQHVPARLVADELRHQPAERRMLGGELVARRLALERQHGVGLHLAHLLDEEPGRTAAHHLEVAVAPAGVEHADVAGDDRLGADQAATGKEMRQVGGRQMHFSAIFRRAKLSEAAPPPEMGAARSR